MNIHTSLLTVVCCLSWLVASAISAPLDVMTFNIRGDFDQGRATDKSEAWNSRSGTHRRELLLELLANHRFDLLGVQEAYRNQVDDLMQALPEYGFYGVGRDDGVAAGEYSGIFYLRDRFRELNQGTFWLSQSPDEVGSQYPDAACVRIASWVILADRLADERECLIINTHWDHVSQPARLHSARVIREQLDRLADGKPVIVMGDLNVDENNKAFGTLVGNHEIDAGPKLIDSYRQVHMERADEATYHAFQGGTRGRRIDFILSTDDFRASEAAIVRTNYDGVYPSDHYPVMVTLELAKARKTTTRQ